jgi:hypothetical protein
MGINEKRKKEVRHFEKQNACSNHFNFNFNSRCSCDTHCVSCENLEFLFFIMSLVYSHSLQPHSIQKTNYRTIGCLFDLKI